MFSDDDDDDEDNDDDDDEDNRDDENDENMPFHIYTIQIYVDLTATLSEITTEENSLNMNTNLWLFLNQPKATAKHTKGQFSDLPKNLLKMIITDILK